MGYKVIKDVFCKCLKSDLIPICQKELINVSLVLFECALASLMTVATDLTSASSIINWLIFRCSVAASMQRLGLS